MLPEPPPSSSMTVFVPAVQTQTMSPCVSLSASGFNVPNAIVGTELSWQLGATLAVTLTAFYIESAPSSTERRLVAEVEIRIKDREQKVQTQVVKAEEPVDGELPGNLAMAAGSLLHRVAISCIVSVGEMS